ncbi:LmeA family phospholipid-binding protein [Streptomyces palmae]|nr:DUF2993 domain-containing protein [Streptomyces palmae]
MASPSNNWISDGLDATQPLPGPPLPGTGPEDGTSPEDGTGPGALREDLAAAGVPRPPETEDGRPEPPPDVGSRPRNPYEELADLADPYDPDDPLGLGLKPDPEGEAAEDPPWSPPRHRRRKRGRRRPLSRLSLLLKLVIAGCAATIILVLADRCAVMYTERVAAQRVQQQLGLAAAPEVDIRGFPFLTQVLGGRLDRVDVSIPDVAADRVSLARVRASARDIELKGSLPDSVKGAVVGKLDGQVLLSFDDLNRELGASQVKFTPWGSNSVRARGKLSVGGQQLRVRAEARILRDGGQGISTQVGKARLDLPGVATYQPGPRAGLRLHRPAAERISRDAGKAKALLSVPAVAKRLGVSQRAADEALRNDDRLHEITGSPRFVPQLMRMNLVDLVTEHPRLLDRIGVDSKVAGALTRIKPPELAEKLALSFRLPKQASDLWLRNITVEQDGIRADLTGVDVVLGGKRERHR